MTTDADDTHNPKPATEPLALRLSEGLGPNETLVARLRQERRPTAWTRGIDVDYPTAWEPNLLCHEAADEIETLRTQLAHWKVFGEHAEGERSKEWARRRELEGALAVQAATSETLRGERGVLVRLLLEADKVVSTIEGECQEEWDQLADLRRAIAAATIPHRPEESDLLSLRACIGA